MFSFEAFPGSILKGGTNVSNVNRKVWLENPPHPIVLYLPALLMGFVEELSVLWVFLLFDRCTFFFPQQY